MNAQNYIQISGRLTADVTPNENKTFARFSIAHNFKGDKTDPLFLNCVIFKKEFDDNKQSIPWDILKKGCDILVTGKLTSNNWTDKSGVMHKGIDLVLDKIRENAD